MNILIIYKNILINQFRKMYKYLNEANNYRKNLLEIMAGYKKKSPNRL